MVFSRFLKGLSPNLVSWNSWDSQVVRACARSRLAPTCMIVGRWQWELDDGANTRDDGGLHKVVMVDHDTMMVTGDR